MHRVRRAVVFVAAAFIALAAAVAPASAGKFGDSVSASAAPGSQISPGHFYLLEAKPGDTITQIFRVSNPNDHAVTANIEAVDATTGELTGVQLAKPSSPKALISRWIVVSSPLVTLQPNEGRDIPFTVHVPSTVKPGQYLAGVSASVALSPDDPRANQPPPDQAGFTLNIRFQRAIAVEIDVPGERAPKLVVTGADPVAQSGGINLGIHMANTGNAFAHGSGVVRVADTKTDFSFKIDTFVPGTAIVYPMQWTKTVVPGTHHVQVDLSYEDGRRSTWSGTVVIAGDAQSKLENSLRNVTVGKHGSGMSPLLFVAVALFVVLVGAAVMMRRRSRAARPVNYRAL